MSRMNRPLYLAQLSSLADRYVGTSPSATCASASGPPCLTRNKKPSLVQTILHAIASAIDFVLP